MKSKRLFQILVVLVLLSSSVGSVHANSDHILAPQDAIVIPRDLSVWNATYVGLVSDSIYEKWQFTFTEAHNFILKATTVTGDLVPLLTLMDGLGTQISSGTDSLTSTQSAGNFAVQIQPQSGSGIYVLTLREVIQTQPSVSTVVSPATVIVGATATATVSLNNVPAEGYTSAEFVCTYNPGIVEVGNIAVTNLFGSDAAVAINGPQNGSFIVAIAGSNGNKATTSGANFTFSATGLQAGQTALQCTVRVSKGDDVLTSLPSSGTTLAVIANTPTATFTPTPTDTATPANSPTPTSSTPVGTATSTSGTPTATTTPPSETPVGTATPTSSTPVGTATPSQTPVASPTSSPTATATPLPNGTLTGKVLAGKPVTVSLYSGNTLVTSVSADQEGDFSLTAPAGSYTVVATASGFLSAQGSASLIGGSNSTKPAITLLAGDIDANNVIDQFDAMTIGMNYNLATPSAADLNNDGVINVLDLELLAANYRETGPLVWEASYP